jgi:nitrogen PTS system EIIA component
MSLQLLDLDDIFLHQNLHSKKQILDKIASHFASKINTHSKARILSFLLKREKISSTATEQGFAVPHCKVKDIDKIYCIFISLKKEVDFDAAGEVFIKLLFAILIPDEAKYDKETLVSFVANTLHKNKNTLKDSNDKIKIKRIFNG